MWKSPEGKSRLDLGSAVAIWSRAQAAQDQEPPPLSSAGGSRRLFGIGSGSDNRTGGTIPPRPPKWRRNPPRITIPALNRALLFVASHKNGALAQDPRQGD